MLFAAGVLILHAQWFTARPKGADMFTLSLRALTVKRLSTIPARAFSLTAHPLNQSNPFQTGPSPPRLPKEEQEIFEKLQRQSTGAFSTPRTPPKVNQPGEAAASGTDQENKLRIDDGGELHPDLRQGVKPEFEGDVNPKTGEVGGPKNEPLRWGAGGDWSYSGRVTDF
ncbi:FMP21 [Uncinocarpus reesii 1704]|uniref:Succinate dehydrogenase assembly factor 4, mitochondrial n=1 Tax=Uncinocarpus reesii (strain UAMH 1704) TaxID=336963 RepID=C4JXP0_UNCRE|nr:FMP21 [Uncinocarpus reesii 1704]EEP81548.1 FMP21 [Uncinocarpus reesii 1704]